MMSGGLPGVRGAPGPVFQTTEADFLNHVPDRYKWRQTAPRDIVPFLTEFEEVLVILNGELDH